VDAAGSDEAIDVSLALLHDRDRFATVVSTPRAAELGLKRLGGGPGADPGTDIREAAKAQLVRDAAEGRLTVPIAGTYPLDQAAEVHRLLTGSHAPGKLILLP
jgi:NADPH:quinone reductase-like Zn-dependent oxidoreductase